MLTTLPGPIGVFDSGIGGLSVLRALRAALPQHDVIYLADSGFAPYGERTEAFVIARSQAVASWLVGQGITALVWLATPRRRRPLPCCGRSTRTCPLSAWSPRSSLLWG